ncbi:MAG TPA: glycosyltransferase [Candidatus Margulisiibacteriota bacterium]|nr:glycosyltransferase [Candidatus Margulisiibacteriota bacterium]
MLVSVVIPVYLRTEWLKKCLEALSVQEGLNGIDMEVLIIDDGSPNSDELKRITAEFRERLKLRYLYQEKLGPAAAKNLGIKNSGGEVICFFDDDSICDKGWVSVVSAEFMKDISCGIVNGKLLSYHRQENSLGLLLEDSVYKPRKSWASCNIAYRRKALEKIGLFDERYKLASWEDNDLGFRAYLHKEIKHIYSPLAIMYHAHERTMDEFREKAFRNGRGLAQFFRKFFLAHPLLVSGMTIYIMKDLYLILHPGVFSQDKRRRESLRFIWSANSLKGYIWGLIRWK